MADNIEDFLRRAAERRQAKAAQAPKPAPAPARPEYTNSRTERLPKAELVDEAPLQAILVESPEQGASVPQHVLMHQVERARAQQARKKKKGEGTVKPVGPPATVITAAEIANPTSQAADQANVDNPVQQLMELMKRPGGMTQAIIMNEILARPEHRW